MTDQIPAEAIDRAAVALSTELPEEPMWSCVVIARKALEAALPFLRPEPSEDDREELDRLIVQHDPDERHPDDQRRCPCGEVVGESDGVVVTTDPYGHLRDMILAAGFRRRPTPSREQIARVIDPAIYPDINRLTGDGWAASLRSADAVLALFEGGEG